MVPRPTFDFPPYVFQQDFGVTPPDPRSLRPYSSTPKLGSEVMRFPDLRPNAGP